MSRNKNKNKNRAAQADTTNVAGDDASNVGEGEEGATEGEEGSDATVETDEELEEETEEVEEVEKLTSVTPRQDHATVRIGPNNYSFKAGVATKVPSTILPHLREKGII